jgi:hypothetical protein
MVQRRRVGRRGQLIALPGEVRQCPGHRSGACAERRGCARRQAHHWRSAPPTDTATAEAFGPAGPGSTGTRPSSATQFGLWIARQNLAQSGKLAGEIQGLTKWHSSIGHQHPCGSTRRSPGTKSSHRCESQASSRGSCRPLGPQALKKASPRSKRMRRTTDQGALLDRDHFLDAAEAFQFGNGGEPGGNVRVPECPRGCYRMKRIGQTCASAKRSSSW